MTPDERTGFLAYGEVLTNRADASPTPILAFERVELADATLFAIRRFDDGPVVDEFLVLEKDFLAMLETLGYRVEVLADDLRGEMDP